MRAIERGQGHARPGALPRRHTHELDVLVLLGAHPRIGFAEIRGPRDDESPRSNGALVATLMP